MLFHTRRQVKNKKTNGLQSRILVTKLFSLEKENDMKSKTVYVIWFRKYTIKNGLDIEVSLKLQYHNWLKNVEFFTIITMILTQWSCHSHQN